MRNAAPRSFHPLPASPLWVLWQTTRESGSPWSILRFGVFVAACTAAVAVWLVQRPLTISSMDQVLIVGLAAGIVASGWFPIRLGSKTNLYVSGIPLYLLCTLFAPNLAVAAVGVGMLTREVSLCARCANPPSVIVGQTGRWMLIALAVSSLMHAAPGELLLAAGVAAMLLLWAGDVLTAPLVLSLPPGTSLPAILLRVARHSYLGELMQYLVAFLLFAMLQTGFEWSVILIAPQVVFLMILLYLFLKGEEDLARAVAQQKNR